MSGETFMDNTELLLTRVDTLADAHVKLFSETLDNQAWISVLIDCVKTLMVDRNISMRHKSVQERDELRGQIDTECAEAFQFYRNEAAKRVAFQDTLLAGPLSEHEH